MDIEVVIPSYKRALMLKEATLNTLIKNGFLKKNISIFVADEQEYKEYKNEISGFKIIVGVKGLTKQRKFIHNQYPKNTPLLMCDDDIYGFYNGIKNIQKLKEIKNFSDISKKSFNEIKINGSKLWGINPVFNDFFMSPFNVYGLRYICGICFGCFAGDSVFIGNNRSYNSSGEDFLATCLSYLKYGSVMRLEYIAPKTKYFNGGGIEAELGGKEARRIDHHLRLKEIVKLFPDIASLTEKKGGVTNIKLKTKTNFKTEAFPIIF